MGGNAGKIAQGGEEKGGSAPKPQDMGSTTEPNMSKVTADSKDGADASANNDFYPGTDLTNSELKFEFDIKQNSQISIVAFG